MKPRNRTKAYAIFIAVLGAISLIVVTSYVPRVKAIQDSEDFPTPYGFIELVAGQTARLTVVNRQSPPPDGDTPPPERDSPVPRGVLLAFDVYVQDPDFTPSCGGIVPVPPTCLVRHRFLRRESSRVDLMPGQAASFNFTAVEGTKVQAFIQTIGNPEVVGNPDITPEPHLIPSLEIRNGTQTLFVVPALAKFFNPQPDPPGH